ncbi:MAG TPA: glycosyltransferase family 4 protein [Chloroflexota bacterium]|nr:glycosyltransferase family 4 protein [Chloroflexota bacterium]
MRVAHVTATFPPYLGGTGNVCYHNARELARRGHEVTVFTAGDRRADSADAAEFAVRRLPVAFRVGNAPCLPSLIGLGRFDVVHVHYPFYFGAELVFLRSFVGSLPYVVTYHQDVHLPGSLGTLDKVHHAALGQWVLRRARMVLATSWDYARASRLRGVMRARAALVSELPNGVDPPRVRPDVDGRGLRGRYGLADDAPVILFVGALDRPHYFKGIPPLLAAFARLTDPRTRLLVVGDGDLRAGYQEEAARLGLGARVIFPGRVSDVELPAHYALADLLVLPSTTLGEAFGVVLLEAMASGKPVIASNLPGVRSVVADGEDGLLARPGDSDDLAANLRALLGDPARRRAMGERGRAKVEARYSWQRVGEQLEEIYEQVAGARSRATPRLAPGEQ